MADPADALPAGPAPAAAELSALLQSYRDSRAVRDAIAHTLGYPDGDTVDPADSDVCALYVHATEDLLSVYLATTSALHVCELTRDGLRLIVTVSLDRIRRVAERLVPGDDGPTARVSIELDADRHRLLTRGEEAVLEGIPSLPLGDDEEQSPSVREHARSRATTEVVPAGRELVAEPAGVENLLAFSRALRALL